MKYLLVIFLIFICYILYNSNYYIKKKYKLYKQKQKILNKNKLNEHFSDYNMTPNCVWNKKNKQCRCNNIQKNFYEEIDNKFCDRNCNSKKSNKECISDINQIIGEKGEYWCLEDNKCNNYIIDKNNSIVNNCGFNNFKLKDNNYYLSKNECLNNIDKCQIYNNNRDKCLKHSQCGWCTDNDENGICVAGTQIGPFNLDYNCKPSTGKKKNSFTLGKVNPYIIQNIDNNSNINFSYTI